MKDVYYNQRIACDVFACQHCDRQDKVCKLGKIKITNCDQKHSICASFESLQ